ncbi:FHA domain-containing protein [Microbacterium stercoris]|uniref:FHA domain-containing protein n=1 Tax=Microbacterium stercoris TaxID=2820289 RepID=A0A939QQE6_9MICO|nr:FHA domain-containing protein [Microbacterium stercoris]MBO3662741.1 hypothetical protein [Microbacterium stercoris]
MASARCAYCADTVEPNSMYCLTCGQLILPGTEKADDLLSGWQQAPRPPRAAPPAPATAVAAPAPSGWPARVQLLFSTGQSAVLAGTAVIGRKPGQTAMGLGAQAIEVDDVGRSISRVHLYLELADGALRAGDAGSSNGSAIERGDRRIPLAASGERLEVLRGDVLWAGDVRIEVLPS